MNLLSKILIVYFKTVDSKENRLTPDVSASLGLMISLYHGHFNSKNSVVMKDNTTAFHMLKFLVFFSLNQMKKKNHKVFTLHN